MTIPITRPEAEALINTPPQPSKFKEAGEIILHALQSSATEPAQTDQQRDGAIVSLRVFGKTRRLSLGRKAIRELRDEARP